MNRHLLAVCTLSLLASACQDSSEGILVIDGDEGIVQSNHGIINGSAPTAAHHDATVSLHQLSNGGGQVYVSPFCSGTLIAPTVVLTAAHCLDTANGGPNFRTMSPGDLAIYVGDEPAADILDHLYTVVDTEIHPSYGRNSLRNDIALVELASPVTEADPVPVLPASVGFSVGDAVNYAGFGQTEFGTSGVKLQVDATIDALGCDISAWGCFGDPGDPATQFSSAQAGGGTCFGDSGGSGFVNKNGTWYVLGITSWGDSNCTIYGVNTRADAYEGYIASFVGTPPTPQPPVADAGGPYSAFEGDVIVFDGTDSTDPDGGSLSYLWDFGDGNFASGATPTHSYAGTGSWTVTLTVTDEDSETDVDSTSATVSTTPACSYTGTVSSSNRDAYHELGTLSPGDVVSGSLSWDSSSANLNLYLQYQNNRGRWRNAASSTDGTPGVPEFITYTVVQNRPHRWKVKRKSGTATYCLAE